MMAVGMAAAMAVMKVGRMAVGMAAKRVALMV